MIRRRTWVLTLGIAAIAVAAARHLRHGMGHEESGGIVMGDAGVYDTVSRLLLGSFYRGVADDVAANARRGSRVLEIGCGPGHLAIELASRGLDVTGLDLDPDMIERARANVTHLRDDHIGRPSFEVGDVAALPHPDDSLDLVVSTLSLHHWADPEAALTEIARVLREDGRALIWDLGSGRRLLHGRMPDPASHLGGSPLRVVAVTPWMWPLRFTPTQRMELVGTRSGSLESPSSRPDGSG